jgi:polysaccharide chain length determinant protein (PEP-CTERM system associated)
MNNLIVQQIFYYVHGIWRRRWIVLLVSWFVCVSGWTMVASLPDVYESSARIYVDTSNILRPLLSGIAIDDNIQNEISFIEKTLTSRPNLEKISRMTDLDITATNPTESEQLLERIKEHTKIKAQGQNLYFVSFEASDPKVAKNVVQSYLTLFVESNLGQSRQDRDSAREFLDEQIREYEVQLTDAEKRLAQFKQENMGLLPGERGFQSTLTKAQEALSAANEQYSTAMEQRSALREQLAQIPQTVEMPIAASAEANGPPSQTEARMIELEYNLDQLLQNYTERHPDVISLKRRLETLREEREAELRALAGFSSENEGEASGPPTYSLPNKVYEEVKLELVKAETAVSILEERRMRIEETLEELQSRAARVPEIEAALTRLNRDYSVIKENHDQLLERREAARLSRAREIKAEEVQFRVVEPPVLPTLPSGPKRGLFIIATLIFGLASGVGFAGLLVFMSGTISSAVGLRESLQLPVLGVVSAVELHVSKYMRFLKLAVFGSMVFLLAGACASLLLVEQKVGIANVIPLKLIGSTGLL